MLWVWLNKSTVWAFGRIYEIVKVNCNAYSMKAHSFSRLERKDYFRILFITLFSKIKWDPEFRETWPLARIIERNNWKQWFPVFWWLWLAFRAALHRRVMEESGEWELSTSQALDKQAFCSTFSFQNTFRSAEFTVLHVLWSWKPTLMESNVISAEGLWGVMAMEHAWITVKHRIRIRLIWNELQI